MNTTTTTRNASMMNECWISLNYSPVKRACVCTLYIRMRRTLNSKYVISLWSLDLARIFMSKVSDASSCVIYGFHSCYGFIVVMVPWLYDYLITWLYDSMARETKEKCLDGGGGRGGSGESGGLAVVVAEVVVMISEQRQTDRWTNQPSYIEMWGRI